MSLLPYRGIPMAEQAATFFANLERDPRERKERWGYLFFGLLMLKRPQQIASHFAPGLTAWAALAADFLKVPLLVPASHVSELRSLLTRCNIKPASLDAYDEINLPSVEVLMEGDYMPTDFSRLSENGLYLGLDDFEHSAFVPLLPAPWASVIIDNTMHIAALLPLTTPYFATERDKLIAMLLHIAQPQTLVLGRNIVFDGTHKPRASKINFSGVGGQIGAGDLLLTHPEELNLYTPLPGAVALVRGPLTSPIEAYSVPLTVGNEQEILTLVIKL